MLQVLVNVFLKIFQLQKEMCGYAKKKSIGKMDKCPSNQQWVLRCPLKRKKRRKKEEEKRKEKRKEIAHTLAKVFKC
jgi:hypothetical protein